MNEGKVRELLAWYIYESRYSALTKGSQDDVNKCLSSLRKLVEGLKKHPEMSDALAQDTLMHEYGYDKAISDVLKLFTERQTNGTR